MILIASLITEHSSALWEAYRTSILYGNCFILRCPSNRRNHSSIQWTWGISKSQPLTCRASALPLSYTSIIYFFRRLDFLQVARVVLMCSFLQKLIHSRSTLFHNLWIITASNAGCGRQRKIHIFALVDRMGIEPIQPACKASSPPWNITAHNDKENSSTIFNKILITIQEYLKHN